MRQIMMLFLATLGFVMCDTVYEIPDAGYEIVIVREPLITQIRNPYQTEYEQMLYPTVRITAGFSTGSGVIIANTNDTNKDEWTRIYILTAKHVLDDQSIVDIELYGSPVITGTVVITDTIRDLALIKPQIPPDFTDKIYTGKLADKNYVPYLFCPVWAVGCSLGFRPRPSAGCLSAISGSYWDISAPILPGNSGGPVYDARTYEIIGIAVRVKVYQWQLVTTMAEIVPINEIYEFLKPQINTD